MLEASGHDVCPVCLSEEPKTLHLCSRCGVSLFAFTITKTGVTKLMVAPNTTNSQLEKAREYYTPRGGDAP